MASVWGELKRRNVVRVAIAYAVVSWITLQFADVLIPLLSLPESVGKLVFLLLAIGFPLALIFAWAFELTPEGLKKEKEVDRSQSITSDTGRKLDYFVIAVMAVALVYFATDKFLLTDVPVTTEVVADDSAAPIETGPSVAVLPFTNMSADESSGYFSDGLADTVLHMLAQVRDLRVAARTSSFKFRDQDHDIAEIGAKLNVGAILEGSVQKSGDKIRVTAQLIDVSNGFHLWSGNFDRNLDDIFAIQDEIANEVVAALKVSLLGETVEQLNRDQTDNVDAYTEYLLAINDLNETTSENLITAVKHLEKAIRLDPNYARAHSTLGRAYLDMLDWGAMSTTEATAAARDAASRALDIAADSSEALAVLGKAELRDGNLDLAGQLLNKAIENGPNDTVALAYLANYQLFDARPADAIATYQKILRIDPLSESAHTGLSLTLAAIRRYSEASETVERFRSIAPNSAGADGIDFNIEFFQGNFAVAIDAMNRSLAAVPDDIDPEGPVVIGHAYLGLGMPAEASRWFDRGVEIDAEHPMSRAAPLFLNYYLQQNEDENVRLARELLEDRIDPRNSSRGIALLVLADHAVKTGRYDIILEAMDNLYPHLFDDPPYDLDKDFGATYLAGRALIQSGDVDRGAHLVNSFLDLQERYAEVYGVGSRSIASRILLGETDDAMERLDRFVKRPNSGFLTWLALEHSPVYDSIRDEPAFIALLDGRRKNAEKQRQILQTMNEDSS